VRCEAFKEPLLNPGRRDTKRVTVLPGWLHTYNHHRRHTAVGGATPASRVTNLSGQNS